MSPTPLASCCFGLEWTYSVNVFSTAILSEGLISTSKTVPSFVTIVCLLFRKMLISSVIGQNPSRSKISRTFGPVTLVGNKGASPAMAGGLIFGAGATLFLRGTGPSLCIKRPGSREKESPTSRIRARSGSPLVGVGSATVPIYLGTATSAREIPAKSQCF